MTKTKYKIEITNRFKKDYKKNKLRNNFNEKEFIKIITILANDEKIPDKYENHLLEPKNERNMGMPYKTRFAFNIY